MRERPLRILTLSSLFPSEVRPRHGIFVETRLDHLVHDTGVEARVIAPVPWFPSKARVFGRYAAFAATPHKEVRGASRIPVVYPRYLMAPGFGMRWQPDAMARAARGVARRWRVAGWAPDVVDAHYLYPDGVAGAMLAERLGCPAILTARGTDVNVIARLPGPDHRVRWAAGRAATVIAVSERLRDGLARLGVDPSKIVCLRNGVDLEVFRRYEPGRGRQTFGLPASPLLVSVGNLVPEKDQALAIRALRLLPEHQLVIVGDGGLRDELRALASEQGVADRLRIIAPVSQYRLAELYSEAEALLLTSVREGWPNVVLEALACGTPVVAQDVGAVHEMLTDVKLGRILTERTPEAVAAAVRDLASTRADPSAVRAHASQFDWRSISLRQHEIFAAALRAR